MASRSAWRRRQTDHGRTCCSSTLPWALAHGRVADAVGWHDDVDRWPIGSRPRRRDPLPFDRCAPSTSTRPEAPRRLDVDSPLAGPSGVDRATPGVARMGPGGREAGGSLPCGAQRCCHSGTWSRGCLGLMRWVVVDASPERRNGKSSPTPTRDAGTCHAVSSAISDRLGRLPSADAGGTHPYPGDVSRHSEPASVAPLAWSSPGRLPLDRRGRGPSGRLIPADPLPSEANESDTGAAGTGACPSGSPSGRRPAG